MNDAQVTVWALLAAGTVGGLFSFLMPVSNFKVVAASLVPLLGLFLTLTIC